MELDYVRTRFLVQCEDYGTDRTAHNAFSQKAILTTPNPTRTLNTQLADCEKLV
jgi:hypothetical protein